MKKELKNFMFYCGCVLIAFIVLVIPVLCCCSIIYNWDGVVKFVLFVMTALDVVSLSIYFITTND